jgi:hypothetical protein
MMRHGLQAKDAGLISVLVCRSHLRVANRLDPPEAD